MHNIEYYDYKETVNKKAIQAELDDYVEHKTWEEGGGDTAGIRWNDNVVCESYDAAKKWIEKHDQGWYDCLAVKYLSPVTNRLDLKEYDDKVKEAYNVYFKRDKAIYPKTRTSEFIGCSKCKSRLATAMLRGNFCPVCGFDLRPESTLKAIETAINKWKKAQEARQEYINKHSKKETRWLVKIEYHT